MICPNCGNEISENVTQCPHCSALVTTGARWGKASHARGTNSASFSSPQAPVSAFVAATPRLHKSKPQGLKIAAGVIAIALAAIGIVASLTLASAGSKSISSSTPEQVEMAAQQRQEAKLHDVTISVQGVGFDETSTPLPVEVSGADAAGNAYNEVAFVTSNGKGLRLPVGRYGVRPAASPITSSGGLFLFSSNKKYFSVDAELEEGAPVDVSEEIQLVLEPADPSDLSTEGIETARNYAMESGLTAEAVDQLLASVNEAIAARLSSIGFSHAQTYRNSLYVGDVRTDAGYALAAGIEGTKSTPVHTDMFLFTNNTLYYAEDSQGKTNQAVSLHRRNLNNSQEDVLATDLCSQTQPYFANGYIVYETNRYGSHFVRRLNLNDPKEEFSLSESLPWNVSKLLGVKDDKVYIGTENDNMPIVHTVPLEGGTSTEQAMGEAYGSIVGMYDNKVVVLSSYNKLAAYSLDGKQLWEVDAPDGFSLDRRIIHQDATLYTMVPSTSTVIAINLEKGESRVFDLDIQYPYSIMLVKDNHLYLAGSNTYNDDSENITYEVFDLDLGSGSVNGMGNFEVAKEEQTDSSDEDWGDTVSYYDDSNDDYYYNNNSYNNNYSNNSYNDNSDSDSDSGSDSDSNTDSNSTYDSTNNYDSDSDSTSNTNNDNSDSESSYNSDTN